MDKKMKRIIGYTGEPLASVRKKVAAPVVEIKEVPVGVPAIIAGELSKVKKITEWINSHPEFKWGVMCNKIGIDKGNFQRTLKSEDPKIKIEFIGKIEDFLKEYGYAR